VRASGMTRMQRMLRMRRPRRTECPRGRSCSRWSRRRFRRCEQAAGVVRSAALSVTSQRGALPARAPMAHLSILCTRCQCMQAHSGGAARPREPSQAGGSAPQSPLQPMPLAQASAAHQAFPAHAPAHAAPAAMPGPPEPAAAHADSSATGGSRFPDALQVSPFLPPAAPPAPPLAPHPPATGTVAAAQHQPAPPSAAARAGTSAPGEHIRMPHGAGWLPKKSARGGCPASSSHTTSDSVRSAWKPGTLCSASASLAVIPPHRSLLECAAC
jgi:hypothetical protein